MTIIVWITRDLPHPTTYPLKLLQRNLRVLLYIKHQSILELLKPHQR